MRRLAMCTLLLVVLAVCPARPMAVAGPSRAGATALELPEPRTESEVSLEGAIRQRRSRRRFAERALTRAQLSQLLWSAQGITGERGRLRASPSAGATYPMEVYAVVGDGGCGGLQAGVYRYVPQDHAIKPHAAADRRSQLASAALGQAFIEQAPVTIVLAAEYARTMRRYGERGVRYVHMEAGHAGQNLYLQAEALGLGTCAVGAFDDAAVARALGLPSGHEPLYVMPVGHPR